MPIHESEKITRKKRIDIRLRKLGWEIIPYDLGLNTSILAKHAVAEYPTVNGPADYAPFVNGKLLGIIEVKKYGIGAQNVLEQAKRYAKGVILNVERWGEYTARYQKAKAWFDKLPQAILAKAFRGELVPQNENDEPTSVLLERIKNEKEKIQNHLLKAGKERCMRSMIV